MASEGKSVGRILVCGYVGRGGGGGERGQGWRGQVVGGRGDAGELPSEI